MGEEKREEPDRRERRNSHFQLDLYFLPRMRGRRIRRTRGERRGHSRPGAVLMMRTAVNEMGKEKNVSTRREEREREGERERKDGVERERERPNERRAV